MENHFEFEGFSDELLIEKQQYSYFTADPLTAGIETVGKVAEARGKRAEAIGKIAEASARKKEAETRITEIGGKRQAQLKSCETAKENKFLFDNKKEKNRIKDCKTEVNKRLDLEEKEQRDIVKRMTAIEEGKLTADLQKSKSTLEEKKSSKKLYVIGGIVALVLILGTVAIIKSKK